MASKRHWLPRGGGLGGYGNSLVLRAPQTPGRVLPPWPHQRPPNRNQGRPQPCYWRTDCPRWHRPQRARHPGSRERCHSRRVCLRISRGRHLSDRPTRGWGCPGVPTHLIPAKALFSGRLRKPTFQVTGDTKQWGGEPERLQGNPTLTLCLPQETLERAWDGASAHAWQARSLTGNGASPAPSGGFGGPLTLPAVGSRAALQARRHANPERPACPPAPSVRGCE